MNSQNEIRSPSSFHLVYAVQECSCSYNMNDHSCTTSDHLHKTKNTNLLKDLNFYNVLDNTDDKEMIQAVDVNHDLSRLSLSDSPYISLNAPDNMSNFKAFNDEAETSANTGDLLFDRIKDTRFKTQIVYLYLTSI